MGENVDASQYHFAEKIEVSETPGAGNRRITIDGELFPYYTQGEIRGAPAETADGEETSGRVVWIPIICDHVEFVDPAG